VTPEIADALFRMTAVAYLIATLFFFVYLAGAKGGQLAGRLAPRVLVVGAALHAGDIVVSSILLHVCPVVGIHFAMSVVSLFACIAYLAMRSRWRIDVIGAVVAPLALTSLLASRFVGGGDFAPGPRIKSALLPVHVAINLLGVALFALAFGAAALYLVQEKQLKKKHLEGIFQRLPPLDQLDRAEHRLLLAGFPLLTIGIVTGSLWVKRIEQGGTAEVIHALFGYVAWIVCALVLMLRSGAGWRGRRAAYGTIAGFGLTVVVLVVYLLRAPAGEPTAMADGALQGPAARALQQAGR
jgi:ABC-type uncharacterized transport system permease subunit